MTCTRSWVALRFGRWLLQVIRCLARSQQASTNLRIHGLATPCPTAALAVILERHRSASAWRYTQDRDHCKVSRSLQFIAHCDTINCTSLNSVQIHRGSWMDERQGLVTNQGAAIHKARRRQAHASVCIHIGKTGVWRLAVNAAGSTLDDKPIHQQLHIARTHR